MDEGQRAQHDAVDEGQRAQHDAVDQGHQRPPPTRTLPDPLPPFPNPPPVRTTLPSPIPSPLRSPLSPAPTTPDCKTASLMAFSCKSAALLASHPLESSTVVAAEKFGYHFGLAFQVIDDLLDFTGTSDTLGKPGLQDMALGLSTAPVLYGIEEQPELKELVARKFGQPGDVHRACELVLASKGLQRTKELANFHAQAAVDACCSLPVSKQRDGLIQLCHVVLSRSS